MLLMTLQDSVLNNRFSWISGCYSSLGLDSHDEDFGQTLGVWGIPSGPYLMLPIFGPSSPRDLIGGPISSFLSGTFAVEKNEARISLFALNALDTRAPYLILNLWLLEMNIHL